MVTVGYGNFVSGILVTYSNLLGRGGVVTTVPHFCGEEFGPYGSLGQGLYKKYKEARSLYLSPELSDRAEITSIVFLASTYP